MENNIPTPSPETIQRVQTLLERIQKTRPTDTRAYLEAHVELVEMGYEAGCAIHALVEPKITRERKKIAKYDACKTPFGLLYLAGCAIAGIAWLLHASPNVCVYIMLIASAPNGVISVIQTMTHQRADVPYNAIAEAISIRDYRMLPILLDLAEYSDASAQQERIKLCAVEYLPQIVKERGFSFSVYQMKTLHGMLSAPVRPSKNEPAHDVKPQVVILHALGHIGDETSLRLVKNLAKNSYYPTLKQAALETLPLLEARVQRMGLDLLRASTAPVEPNKEYLRPASGAQTEPKDELLRPHNSD